ncbi:YkgJ family cysteine cluster protein [Echinimonas agarilytica]|uniref:YkgJ family cysteine cluster protein n=1 Tax=Echinimonas agarilytica TaxID=1215918 RepID=A0AA42B8B5_9GAMM|nr:YkgJ family cysteine cluster protein [Echinimonas agarilytica]MCM2681040.1 YkgJ family cysteine cluster protein [Echinimonas agarilytica]
MKTKEQPFQCRAGCGACCIVPSISSAIPGMPEGKPAGTRCIQLNEQNMCKLFGLPERPAVCLRFYADIDTCGTQHEHAFAILDRLESDTQ